jgi:hypothetical protein
MSARLALTYFSVCLAFACIPGIVAMPETAVTRSLSNPPCQSKPPSPMHSRRDLSPTDQNKNEDDVRQRNIELALRSSSPPYPLNVQQLVYVWLCRSHFYFFRLHPCVVVKQRAPKVLFALPSCPKSRAYLDYLTTFTQSCPECLIAAHAAYSYFRIRSNTPSTIHPLFLPIE